MHIHLDAVGGISGNMFVGALLHAYPEWAEELPKHMQAAGFGEIVQLEARPHTDGILTGTYFEVKAIESNGENAHEHRHFASIKKTLEKSDLDPAIKQHAIEIFLCLAKAEASVHGTSIDEVAFHEVGAWDSIADIVCAAVLIEKLNNLNSEENCTWSVSALPLGNGLVETAHGSLPIPAPAVSILLQGFTFFRDDIEGERVTPTGAAILNYLIGNYSCNNKEFQLKQSGYGFGSRKFPGISNILRATVFAQSKQNQANQVQTKDWQEEQILQINFEVDDQTAEELAVAVDILREQKGVLDVYQMPVFAKKGRIATSIQVLADCSAEQAVITQCFQQTTTLGLRKQTISRSLLKREEAQIEHEGKNYRTKQVHRPDGEITRKIELDDVVKGASTQQQRQSLRSKLDKDSN